MKSGYKIFWTDNALKELENTIEYLEENWNSREIKNLALKIEETLSFISQNPNLFQASEFRKDIYRAIILNYNTLYYRVNGDQIEIISFFLIVKVQRKEN